MKAAAIVCAVLLAFLSIPLQGEPAAAAPVVRVDLNYYPALVRARGPATEFARWNARLWGPSVYIDPDPARPWFLYLSYLTSARVDREGFWTGATGTDRVVDVSLGYNLIPGPLGRVNGGLNGYPFMLSAKVGWGKVGWDTDFGGGVRERFRSKGMFGGVFGMYKVNPNLSLNSSVTWSPSNRVTIESTRGETVLSEASRSSTFGWHISAAYTVSRLNFEAGYRGITARTGNNLFCTDCSFNYSGLYFRVGTTIGAP